MLSNDLERFNYLDALCVFLFLFVFISLFVADAFYRPILVVMGLLAAVFSFKFAGVKPVPNEQLSRFLENIQAGAHRGLSEDAPENTLEAFRISKTFGADSIEMDLEYTKDDVAILMHDDTVDRTTNGTGEIREMTWDQVQLLNAAAKFNGGQHPVAKVPLLSQAVEQCLQDGFKIFFDVKRYHSKLVDTITGLFKKHPELYERSAVCSFDPRISYLIKRADSHIITSHTWRPYFASYHDYERTKPRFNGLKQLTVEIIESVYLWSLHKFLWKFTGADLILANHKTISAEYLRFWRERGLGVVAWTVNDYQERLFYLNSLKCPFLTDRLSDMHNMLRKFRSMNM